ncbi:MAG: NAD(P)H-hydrate dehydratase [Desulfobacterales bacterium]|jgi:NAD(P)H-hydrate epimerase|nr:NAD(P)H-hydrate dehydratase [Desulfobacterales bacterium]
MYVVTASEMREMDSLTIRDFGLPGRLLMENAGYGAVRAMLTRFPDLASRRIGIMAGCGNNGGDGFVMARYLARKGAPVTVFLLTESSKVKGDAAANLHLLNPIGVPVIEVPDMRAFAEQQPRMRHTNLWVDAILGTGLTAEVRPFYQAIIEFINASGKPVVAVDIPSGLSSDTALPCGAAVQAQLTTTFAYPKIGHFLYPGAELTGELEIVDIGIPTHITDRVAPKQQLLTREIIGGLIPKRRPDAHKGATGHLLVIAGGPGKTGAAVMSATSAMRAGAGLVTLGIASSLCASVSSHLMEVMTSTLPETGTGVLGESALMPILELSTGKKCLAIGPGLGAAEDTRRLVHGLLPEAAVPLVIDADGLNCLSDTPQLLQKTKVPAVITPHPGEMARLTGLSTAAIQKDRVACARNFAVRYHTCVVLKGARTVIAFPDGHVFINPTGNAGMASGGMGDVLTGVIAGLIVQGMAPQFAALAGVYLHGAAADRLSQTSGPFGFLASEVMAQLPYQIAALAQPETSAARHNAPNHGN